MFCEKGGMSYHNHEGKHHAVQSLDQYVKFMENIMWTTQPTDRIQVFQWENAFAATEPNRQD